MNYIVFILSFSLLVLSSISLADTATNPVPAITEQKGLYLGVFGGTQLQKARI